MRTVTKLALPGAKLAALKMPGHWLLARLGKRVLRPGGLELTRCMLRTLDIRRSDRVVEFAPGVGVTTGLVLDLRPASYTAIEEDEAAARRVGSSLTSPCQRCLIGSAAHTGLPDNSASVVYGEAMLTMQATTQKRKIVQEASRILKSGGRYGIHELCLVPDHLDDSIKLEIQRVLSETIHVGARPLTATEWRALMESEGFDVPSEILRPMRLLKPHRVIQDEGVSRALRFAWNLWHDAEARQRVLAMRRVFEKYSSHLAAIMLVAIKRPEKSKRRNAPPEKPCGEYHHARFDRAQSRWDVDWRRARFS